MTLFELTLLHFLQSKGYTAPLKSVKLTDIAVNAKLNTLGRRVRALCGKGLVEKGISAERAYTYFITAKGIEFYKGAMRE